MGDTFHDPIDHLRTTRPHAGRALINVLSWPGYLLITVGIIAGIGCLDAFGTGHDHQGLAIAVLALIAVVTGVAWVLVEHKRIGRVHDQWHLAHPGVRRQHSSH